MSMLPSENAGRLQTDLGSTDDLPSTSTAPSDKTLDVEADDDIDWSDFQVLDEDANSNGACDVGLADGEHLIDEDSGLSFSDNESDEIFVLSEEADVEHIAVGDGTDAGQDNRCDDCSAGDGAVVEKSDNFVPHANGEGSPDGEADSVVIVPDDEDVGFIVVDDDAEDANDSDEAGRKDANSVATGVDETGDGEGDFAEASEDAEMTLVEETEPNADWPGSPARSPLPSFDQMEVVDEDDGIEIVDEISGTKGSMALMGLDALLSTMTGDGSGIDGEPELNMQESSDDRSLTISKCILHSDQNRHNSPSGSPQGRPGRHSSGSNGTKKTKDISNQSCDKHISDDGDNQDLGLGALLSSMASGTCDVMGGSRSPRDEATTIDISSPLKESLRHSDRTRNSSSSSDVNIRSQSSRNDSGDIKSSNRRSYDRDNPTTSHSRSREDSSSSSSGLQHDTRLIGTPKCDHVASDQVHDSQVEQNDQTSSTKNSLLYLAKNKNNASISAKLEGSDAAKQAVVPPQRSQPLASISNYVDSLINIEYDVKKYTCFFCNPCKAFMTQTSYWEEHMQCAKHKKNTVRWRECQDLQGETFLSEPAVHQNKVDNASGLQLGADWVVEICNSETGRVEQWICLLCNAVCITLDLLLGHLRSFHHIDNYVEATKPEVYAPPSAKEQHMIDNFRCAGPMEQNRISEIAKELIAKLGRGLMRAYVGDKTVGKDDAATMEENAEMEESLVMGQMEHLFTLEADNIVLHLPFDKSESVANRDYEKAGDEITNLVIGLQYIVEIWPPSRRATPVYYCILCDYLVVNCLAHCSALKHCIAYLMKHYKSVYECVLLESGSEEEVRKALTLAKEKVLNIEGRQARVDHVVQVKLDPSDVFVAINARIAKQIVKSLSAQIPPPPRATKEPCVTPEVAVKEVAHTNVKDDTSIASGSRKARQPVRKRQYRIRNTADAHENNRNTKSAKTNSSSDCQPNVPSHTEVHSRLSSSRSSAQWSVKSGASDPKPAIASLTNPSKSNYPHPRLKVNEHGRSYSSLSRQTRMLGGSSSATTSKKMRSPAATTSSRTKHLPSKKHYGSSSRAEQESKVRGTSTKSSQRISQSGHHSSSRTDKGSNYDKRYSESGSMALLTKYSESRKVHSIGSASKRKVAEIRRREAVRRIVVEKSSQSSGQGNIRSRLGVRVMPGFCPYNSAKSHHPVRQRKYPHRTSPKRDARRSRSRTPDHESRHGKRSATTRSNDVITRHGVSRKSKVGSPGDVPTRRPYKPHLSRETVGHLENALQAIGISLGRSLTIDDLQMLKERLGSSVVDDLISKVTEMSEDRAGPSKLYDRYGLR